MRFLIILQQCSRFSIKTLLSVIIIMLFVTTSSYSREKKFITIGTGSISGIYYPMGGSICQFVNKAKDTNHLNCSVEITGGSIVNLNSLKKNVSSHGDSLDFAIVQSDWLYNSYYGKERRSFKGHPFKELRFLLSLHTEAFTVVVRNDPKEKGGIFNLNQIKGKKVNMGAPGSGNRGTMNILMAQKGWTKKDFRLVSELKASEQAQALCDKKIDVMIYSVGHPNGSIKEASTSCGIRIIPIHGPKIDKLIKEHPYYTYTEIPGGMYKGEPNAIKTFGSKAVLVTTTQTSDETAYQVTKAVYENFEDKLKKLIIVLGDLRKEDLVEGNSSVPFHNGALTYFKEIGLK